MLGRARGVRGARRWQLGAGERALAGAHGRAGGSSARARSASGRRRARGAAWQGARARRQLGGKRARGRAQQAWARGLGVAWAPGLALGCALGALGPFSIRFDSFFFPESPNEHRSL